MPKERKNCFAVRLKELRKGRGLTQRDMARKFHLSDVGYGGWERGDTEPSIDNVIRLCRFFGCSSDSLIGLEPMPPAIDGSALEDLKRHLAYVSSEARAASDAVHALLRRRV